MERWLDKVLSSSHPETSLKKEVHVSTKKIKINKRNVKNHRKDTKARVDKYP